MLPLILAALAVVTPVETEMTVPGPQGPLAGTLTDAGKGAPVVVMIPGSGPTDRNGDNPLGVTAGTFRLLAGDLARRHVSTVRIDKRGMFGSKAAIPDANHVTIADYAGDAREWAKAAAKRTGNRCAWLLGHSEGGLVALAAAQMPEDICGLILVSAPGKPLADTMRAQLRANPANAPILAPALAAIDSLASGKTVDPATLPAPLAERLFPAAVQPYLIDVFAYDPAALAKRVTLPMLIVQGDRDLQIPMSDAEALAAADPKATLVRIVGANHVLKHVDGHDRMANLMTYRDSSLPVVAAIPDAIAAFVGKRP